MSDLIADLETLAQDFDADPDQRAIGYKVVRDVIATIEATAI